MPTTYWRVQCPFYRKDLRDGEGRFRIVCEGIVEESNVILRYNKRQQKIDQMRIFCCQYYKNCEVYRMLMEAKYDEEEAGKA